MDWKALVVVLESYQVFKTTGCVLWWVCGHHCYFTVFLKQIEFFCCERQSSYKPEQWEPWVGMEHRSWRPPPAPQPSVLMESSQQFWEEGMTFSAPLQLCLFLSGRTHTAGTSVVHPAWEFCLNTLPLSVCTSLTVLSPLKSFFTGGLRVASPCLWLIVLIAAVMNCVGTYWEIKKYPLYSMVFLILEMHKRCQISAHLKFHWDWTFRDHL